MIPYAHPPPLPFQPMYFRVILLLWIIIIFKKIKMA